uniref:Solute carrier family 1 (Glial high affinity glutamate transporter), member 3 n=1 Tax=Pan troglodytes TaxID=9598 RepID=K7BAK9_PANTR
MEKSPRWGAGWRDSSRESVNAHFWPRRKCRTLQRRMLKVTCFGMLLCCSQSPLSLWVSHLIKNKKNLYLVSLGHLAARGILSDELVVGIKMIA